MQSCARKPSCPYPLYCAAGCTRNRLIAAKLYAGASGAPDVSSKATRCVAGHTTTRHRMPPFTLSRSQKVLHHDVAAAAAVTVACNCYTKLNHAATLTVTARTAPVHPAPIRATRCNGRITLLAYPAEPSAHSTLLCGQCAIPHRICDLQQQSV
jgi:hypothetical protein